jgi:hypothetical protein
MRAPLRSVGWGIVAFATAGLCACAVPLGPGYGVRKESLAVRHLGGPPPRLVVHASYRLENSGNTELKFIDVALPDEKVFGRRDLRINVDGREVNASRPSAGAATEESRNIFRIPFDSGWPAKQKRTLDIEYALAPALPGGAEIAVAEASFHFSSVGWFPELRTPKGLFASGGGRADRTYVTFQVPENFRLETNGRLAGKRKHNGAMERQLRGQDLGPFAVAGRYEEQEVRSDRLSTVTGEKRGPHDPTLNSSLIYWTSQPLVPADAQSAGQRLLAAWRTCITIFGQPKGQAAPFRVVETPANLPANSPNGDGPAVEPFAEGVLVNREGFALGVGSEGFYELVVRGMAYTWFGGEVALRPDAKLTMGKGLADYASILVAEASDGEPARRRRVAELLNQYDDARAHVAEQPLRAISYSAPWEQRRIAATKAPLFFIALEDEYGESAVRRGLADLVDSLRGETIGWAELRSSLEMATGKNLAEFFRTWLDNAGIPADFRSRYEPQTKQNAKSSE